jgi:SAM-dependent methyltransferase
MNNEYDPFAAIYNRHWGADYRKEALPILERLLLSRLKAGQSVLDVCCGTGQVTSRVRELGFAVSGLDASAEMLRYAAENAPGCDLHHADARSFELDRKFHAAYSVFESLNHIPDVAGLEQVFRQVRKHLRPRAPFLFDLNREDAFDLYWNTTDAVVTDDRVCVLRMEYDGESRIATCQATAFEKGVEPAWARTDFTLRQTCHDEGDVDGALRDAGFRDVALFDARDVGMEGDAGYARTFFLAIA